ncbi:transcriptional regulator [Bacillus wiedmannii]|uniref:helix-turn-helix domain-containing protein n=1 Tax=Bacillus TaxID=1386 RepID=UPI000BF994A8|nr:MULTISPECIES: helix-turn-helix transcriptional regulator [Bacillus]PEP29084.1 transcriptional regulator [Bacillus wiedmannii]PFY99432.1 transcriptional regulator [Bacillus wiedmannii]PHF29112.1 transcriptional regulator [Bacillus wiedmannii]
MRLVIDLERICISYNTSLAELAEQTGIQRPNLSRIKRNRSISLKNLGKIAQAVGETDISKLLIQE